MKNGSFLLAFLTVVMAAGSGCSVLATKEEVAALRGDVDRLTVGSRIVQRGTELLRQDVEKHRGALSEHAETIYRHEDRLKATGDSIATHGQAITVQKGRIDRAEREIATTNSKVSRLDRSVEETNTRLAALEKRVVGVRRMTEGRLGVLEDTGGIDHKNRLLRVSGFATKSSNPTGTMKKRLDEIAELEKKGRCTVASAAGFADTVPYLDGNKKDLNPELAQNRAKAVAEYLGKALNKSLPFEGHGATAKFGEQDMNRSALVYLTCVPAPVVASVATPAPATSPVAVPTPATKTKTP
ncbi:MAG: hypothetical protein HYT98_04440 [Candidatus Sungbacteria bacterium]|nr:hypothetical protein [Candidatus Sungbacteria bacterium]